MNGENILVVDDDSEIVALCRTILEKDGYGVDKAAMGRQALDLLGQKNYNFVILDLDLPDIDGMEILKTIKTKRPDVGVIIMTGIGSDEIKKKAIQLGADDYISKPFTVDEMCLIVRHCLEKQKLAGEVEKFKDYARNLEREVKVMQDELVQSEKMSAMARVIGYVAHELRNPLANIKTFSQFCLTSRTISLDEKVRERLEIILKNVEKANKIITDTLAFSKPIKISLNIGSINEILEKVCEGFEPDAGAPAVKIIKKLSAKLPSSKFDPGHMERVFSNIVQNASQAMPDGGTLTVETLFNKKEKRITVNFIDTGRGIDEKEVGLIFEPFFTKRQGGVGLGLSFAREIIQLHRGKISAASKEGKGTTITVELPVEIEGEK